MGHRADQAPVTAALGQTRQVLGDLHARRGGLDRVELAANPIRGIGLQVEAVLLGQATREKDVEHGLGLATAGSQLTRIGRPQCLQVVGPQSHQAQGSGLDRRSARHRCMLPVGCRVVRHRGRASRRGPVLGQCTKSGGSGDRQFTSRTMPAARETPGHLPARQCSRHSSGQSVQMPSMPLARAWSQISGRRSLIFRLSQTCFFSRWARSISSRLGT